MNAKARQRAEVIFQVRSGQITATEAARKLNISRQQYYQWEQRALQALVTALEDQPTGRPKRRQRTRRRNRSNAGCNNWSNRCNASRNGNSCASC